MINKYLEKLKKEIKITRALLRSRSASNGMTYVELIVVLSIFAVLSSVAVYNYGAFQDRVDIRNLASDIALKIVEAQKSSLSGLLPTQIPSVSPWYPSYGIYFNINTGQDSRDPSGGGNKSFIYFVDLNNNYTYDAGEALDTITIIKNNNYIDHIETCPDESTCGGMSGPLSITFKRPDSRAFFYSYPNSPLTNGLVKIFIKSPKGTMSSINIYASGRVQIK